MNVLPEHISDLVARGAIFYISDSAGKDSQAMYIVMRRLIPHDQIVLVYSDLGHITWPGAKDHIRENTSHELNIVKAGKKLLGMAEKRGMWPSAKHRQCTSDLKRDPIHTFMRRDMKARGAKIGVNCQGIRAQESTARSKKKPFKMLNRMSAAGREVYEYYPIFDMGLFDVWCTILGAGQKPHYAYYEGNERFSCILCIMGSLNDLKNGARMNPGVYVEYVQTERRMGHTMFTYKGKPIPLDEYVGIAVPH